MLIRRSALPTYPDLDKREGNLVLTLILRSHPIALLDLPDLYCYVVHGHNTWPVSHVDGFLRKASQRHEGPAYTNEMCRLGKRLPIADYAGQLRI